jgi:purine-nucleoside phosphorylase
LTAHRPTKAVVLGSGLGAFADQLADRIEIPYTDIPGWPHSTAMGHAGKLVVTPDVIVLSGRAHLYEGHPIQSVVFGVRVLHALGIRSIVFTNAAGGINLSYSQGALVLISDHINLQPANPLTGPNDDALGPRFPDLTEAYSVAYRDIARKAGSLMGLTLQEGVYAALCGPNYETPAEIRYLRTIGADLVGMSTVPEVILANYLGIKVLAISCVTNLAAGMTPGKINHEEVLQIGRQVRGTLVQLLNAVLPQLT